MTNLETILLIRHARSVANDDPSVYRTTPDHAISLSRPSDDEGALLAGRAVRQLGLLPTEVTSWCSTYLRCQQTEALVLGEAFGATASVVRRRMSFLLREQEFGDWDSMTEEEIARADPLRFARRKLLSDALGRFYFRYPGGESRADVTQRMVVFLGKIHRTSHRHHIVFLHGVTQRAFRMSWMDRSVEWFEAEPNPGNASVLLLERTQDRDEHAPRWRERRLTP